MAWSSGSLLNLAQGKFGRFDESAVRWLAAVGTSYGAIAVKSDSPYKTLDDLVKALPPKYRTWLEQEVVWIVTRDDLTPE